MSATPSSRTFGNEAQLPRVPLPTLEESCERFLDWCAPLLRGDELAATKDAVASFLHRRSPAHELQAALERYDQDGRTQSWLDAFWSDRYLGRRDRIALNANFFLLLKVSDQGQIERAAGLIAAAVNYKLRLDRERIPPVVRNGHALSMEQQRFLFSTTRIPGRERDTVRSPYSASWPGPSQERHVAVLSRGRIFRMDVIGPGGRPHSLDDLADGLQSVTGERAPGRGRPSVCHLTAKPRAEWAESRRALLDCHPGNAKALDAIETALFCLCLDQTAPKNALEACDELLHGDSGNRWFDKALSLIVFEDGTAGLNVEHSKLDGSTVVDLVDSLLEQTPDEHTRQSGAKRQGMPLIEAVAFDLNAELQRDAGLAAAAFAAQAADTATHVLEIEDIGSDRVKELGMSPDAFVQMAFQLAHKRTRGAVGATYESIATREYRNGRTEAMRVVTPEVLRFVTAMDEADAPTRRKAFRVAAEKHVERVRQCRAGAAPEQHLWELQLLQRRHGEATAIAKPPALYETPGWLAMRNDYLSTSTTPSANIRYGGFGPTSERCIGLGYTLLRDRFRLHLSTRRSSADELPRFVEKLREALRELEGLLAPSARSAEPPKATALAHDAWLRPPQ